VKLGTENKTKTATAAGLVVVAGFALYNWMRSGDDSASTPAAAGTTAAASSGAAATKPAKATLRKSGPVLLAQSLDPTLRFDLLKSSEDVTYKGSGRDIFQNQPEPPPVTPVKPVINPGPAPPPPPPPIPLKFYGFSGNKSGPKQVFLSKGDDIFVAKEGQIIDRRYRILKISPNSVEVEDVLTNNRQTLPLTTG